MLVNPRSTPQPAQAILQPDLPLRLKEDVPLTQPIRDLFYALLNAKGYIDYPFATALPGRNRSDINTWYEL